jgi:2-methylisocitrate lyase-like PEP mutase family enzyme
MTNKLEASLSARQSAEMFIIGRTDAAHVVGIDEALKRVARFEALGVDAVLATGLASKEDMQRVRDTVKVPVIAVVVPGSPWLALSAAELAEIGIEMALYPATTLLRMAGAIRDSLKDIASGRPGPETAMTFPELSQVLRADGWAEIDARWK